MKTPRRLSVRDYRKDAVSGKKDFPEAVLIRGVEGFNGPGKLTKQLRIDKSLNKENLVESERLWIEDDGAPPGLEKTACKRNSPKCR